MDLKEKFQTGEFAILAEIEPPKGVDVTEMVDNARRVKGRVDAFLVPEMSNAVMRMSSLGAAMILQNKGMPTMIQMNCRDRNRLALQADLLAAYGCGIANVMAVTGEDPSFGDHHQARSVYDIDIFELLRAAAGLQEGRDMAGIELHGAPRFWLGSTVNAGAMGRSTEIELEEMNKMAAAGAQFFVTPPLFELEGIKSFMARIDNRQIRIIPTVLLLKSVGMARYMARNVENVFIPEDVITRLQKAGDKVRECLRIASEMVIAVRENGFGGVLVATLGWENKLPEILQI